MNEESYLNSLSMLIDAGVKLQASEGKTIEAHD